MSDQEPPVLPHLIRLTIGDAEPVVYKLERITDVMPAPMPEPGRELLATVVAYNADRDETVTLNLTVPADPLDPTRPDWERVRREGEAARGEPPPSEPPP